MHFDTAACSGYMPKERNLNCSDSCRNSVTRKVLRIMKLTAIFLLSAALTISAAGHTQNISLNEKNATLQKVFKEIHKQSGYQFFYKDELLDKAGRIDVQVSNMPLEQVLNICFKNLPLTYTITDKTIVVNEKVSDIRLLTSDSELNTPPPIDVKGRVVNENGEPVIATVTVKGTKNAVTTDANGNFVIRGVDENATLVITSVSIEQALEVKVNGRTDLATLNVKTKITTGDVVVVEANTGYQKVKPNEATGSFNVIEKQVLNEQFSTNILDRLRGVTNSVLFNSGKRDANDREQNISVRGLSTINASTSPLIVLDDVIYTGRIEDINPNDVENITILKDAAATSIYGVGGANGVIVITTRKARLNKKFSVDFNSVVNVTPRKDLFSVHRMSVSDYIDVEQLLFKNGFFDNNLNNKYVPITPVVNTLDLKRRGIITAADSATQIDALKKLDARNNYNKYFSSAAVTQQYSVSLSGGARNLGWMFSGSYEDVLSSQDATDRKLNFSWNNVFKATERLSFTVGSYYTNAKSVSGKPEFDRLTMRDAMYMQYADENGRPLSLGTIYNRSYTDTAGNGQLLDWNYYPLTDYKHDRFTRNRDQLAATINVDYKLSKEVQLVATYNYQKENFDNLRYSDQESFYTRDLINIFTNLAATNIALRNPVPLGGILQMQESRGRSHNFRLQSNFNKSWHNNSINGIAGAEVRELYTKGNNSSVYGYREQPLSTIPVDYRSNFRHYIYGSEIRIPNPIEVVPPTTYRFVSLYGNIAYNLAKKYDLFASFRKDASNIFGVKSNDRWNPLWSAGLKWDIFKESFYKFNSTFPLLQLRFTYGYSGNLDNTKTALPLLSYQTNFDLNTVSSYIAQPNNPKLKWEKSRQYNIGLNFSTAKEKITGSLEYYQKLGTDLYGPTAYDYTTFGFGTITEITRNVANLKTTGMDIQAGLKIFNSRIFNWQADINYSWNKNVVTKYNTLVAAEGTQILFANGNKMTPVIGKPLYALVAFRWAGLDANGNPQGYLNGHPSVDYLHMLSSSSIYTEQIIYKGSASPTRFGSIANRFRWHSLSVSVNISYRGGYYFLRPSFQTQELVERGVGFDYEKRWQRPGDELKTTVPSFLYPYPATSSDIFYRDRFYKYSELNVCRADNIRLQYINMSYDVPLGSKTITVYGNIANLGFIWKAHKEDIDPDSPNSYESPKSYTIGVRVKM